jgi:hypothetical protein
MGPFAPEGVRGAEAAPRAGGGAASAYFAISRSCPRISPAGKVGLCTLT